MSSVMRFDEWQDSNGVPVLDGTGGNLALGKILQVVQTVKTNAFTESLAQGAEGADVTGLTVSITPSSATSKVLVLGQFTYGPVCAITLYRDGTVSTYRGDANSSERRASTAGVSASGRVTEESSIMFLDSPNTTSAITYSVRMTNIADGTQTVLLNRSNDSSGDARQTRTPSSITVMEVAV